MGEQTSSRQSSCVERTLEVFLVFLRLGLTSFGGPIAHIGYFRREFVERRRWMDDEAFTDLVALCQFLPGPASSQTGFAIGLLRAGWGGGFAAWCGFTLPSMLLMIAFAIAAPNVAGPTGVALVHGLKLVAVAVVAQAVWDMGRRLCTDRRRVAIALIALALLSLLTSVYAQLAVIAAGAVLGYDILQLATLLYFTGGLINPFAVLLVAPVAVAATSLTRFSTVILGAIAMRDEPRADAKRGLMRLTEAGVRTVMLTGDNARTAQTIGEHLGIAGHDREALALRPDTGGSVKQQHLPRLVLTADPQALADLRAVVLAPMDELRPAAAAKLRETLRAWLLHQGRREEVAAALFVHPQTIRYRMTQLRELFGERLDDPDSVLALTLALGVEEDLG